jgi:hypothetical protein
MTLVEMLQAQREMVLAAHYCWHPTVGWIKMWL